MIFYSSGQKKAFKMGKLISHQSNKIFRDLVSLIFEKFKMIFLNLCNRYNLLYSFY